MKTPSILFLSVVISLCIVMVMRTNKNRKEAQQSNIITIDIPKPQHGKTVMYTEETQWNRDNHIYTIETDSIIVVYRPKEIIDQLK